jgi:hypothetical protein
VLSQAADNAAASAVLIEALWDPALRVREQAREVLESLGEEASGVLDRLLKNCGGPMDEAVGTAIGI